MRQLNGASDGDIRSPVQSQAALMPSSNIARLQEYCQPSRECTQPQPRLSAGLIPAESKVVVEALSAVTERLSWATDELRRSTSIETCCQLCMLIRSCSDAMQSLKRFDVAK